VKRLKKGFSGRTCLVDGGQKQIVQNVDNTIHLPNHPAFSG
jgi:hypothetical protein